MAALELVTVTLFFEHVLPEAEKLSRVRSTSVRNIVATYGQLPIRAQNPLFTAFFQA